MSFTTLPAFYSIQNFVNIGLYFTEVWRYNYF